MNHHYLEHITTIGEQRPVSAIEDICNQDGVKLIAKGISINSHFLSLLLQHKLLKPIDLSISIADTLTPGKLKNITLETVVNSSHLQAFLPNMFGMSTLISHIGHIALNPVLANKMTVMRLRLPAQFEHSLLVAFICLYLGKICKVSAADMQKLAHIGLFHDIGVLHIDPALLDATQELDAEQWRQIHAHPLIGFLILQKQPELNSFITQAILEHHERMDGSGYPRSLKGDQISPMGRIIAVAETVIGICQKDSCEHLLTILKSNINKLDKNIVYILNHALYEAGTANLNHRHERRATGLSQETLKTTQEMAETINAIFACWYKHKNNIQSEFSHLLNDRLENIRQSLITAGISPLETVNLICQYEQDPITTAEVASLLRETLYQLQRILDEAQRRKTETNEYDAFTRQWMEFTEKQLYFFKKSNHFNITPA